MRIHGSISKMKMEIQKKIWTSRYDKRGVGQRLCFVSSTYFTVHRRGSNGFITKKTILFQGSKGGPTFTRGVHLLSGGARMLISVEPCVTCELPGGGGGGGLSTDDTWTVIVNIN